MSNEQRTLQYLISRTQQRSNTQQGWIDENPVLLAGEIGIESDTTRLKVGDGISTWSVLPYWTNANAAYIATNGIQITDQVISATLLYDEFLPVRRRIYTAEHYPVSSREPLPAYVSG